MKGLLKKVFAVAMSALMVFLAPVSVSAISEADLYFYGQNNILYFTTDRSINCFGTLSGSTIVEKTMSYLLSIGFTEAAVAGIYGNMIHEGLGGGILLNHENAMDSMSDIGYIYKGSAIGNRPINENDIRGLDDASVMHGLGLIQWSYLRRVNFLKFLDSQGLGKYAREWNGNSYVYDSVSFDEMATMEGQDVADAILAAELEFLRMEMAGEVEGERFAAYQNDIDMQGLAKYGVTSGMNVFDSMNRVSTPAEAAELFFSTMEMPGWGNFSGDGRDRSVRARSAEEGYEFMKSAGIVASGGATTCSGNQTIADTAVELSWEGNRSHAKDDPKPEYVAAMQAVGTYVTPCNSSGCAPKGASCDIFVSTVMRYSGSDPEFPVYGPGIQENHMLSHPDMYMEIENQGEQTDLQPGDIFVVSGEEGGRHIYLYVGEIDGKRMQASASFNGRTGEHYFYMSYSDYGKPYRIFRRINS